MSFQALHFKVECTLEILNVNAIWNWRSFVSILTQLTLATAKLAVRCVRRWIYCVSKLLFEYNFTSLPSQRIISWLLRNSQADNNVTLKFRNRDSPFPRKSFQTILGDLPHSFTWIIRPLPMVALSMDIDIYQRLKMLRPFHCQRSRKRSEQGKRDKQLSVVSSR